MVKKRTNKKTADSGRVIEPRVRAKGKVSEQLSLARKQLVEVQTENARLERRRREIEVGQAEGRLIPKELAISTLKKLGALIKARLDARLRSEVPSRCGGLSSEEIAFENGKVLDEAYAEIAKAQL